MTLVAGVDSSTQSCKVLVVDADTGTVVREGRASHPDGTEVQPEAWEAALHQAIEAAGGLNDVAAVAVGGQQHGMVCLDPNGEVVRPALLWNDTRSAGAAADLVRELGNGDVATGRQAWADGVGSVPVASFTVTKLRWLADHEPEHADRIAAVALPHDWLTWRLAGTPGLDALVTDRGDASGTGYWSPATGDYRRDLLELALRGRTAPIVPRVAGPAEAVGAVSADWLGGPGSGGGDRNGRKGAPVPILGPGSGDNAAAALGLGADEGDVVVSIGTSGVVTAVSAVPSADPSGVVAGFADATGRYLPLVCTLNAARVLDATARLLGVDHAELSRLALHAPAGADGLVLVPYLEGERTPDLPLATGSLHGLTLGTMTAAHLARATFEGLMCGLADGLDALRAHGATVRRVLLVGGAARSEALQQIAPAVLGCPVVVPEPGEYVARGAARQAAWVMSGANDAPEWSLPGAQTFEAEPAPAVRERYAQASSRYLERI